MNKSFFYRTHTLWNALPLNIREIKEPGIFRTEVTKRLWKSVLSDNDTEFDLVNTSTEDDLLDSG